MKKSFYIICTSLCLVMLLVGCGNGTRIKELENEIEEIESSIELKENELEEWEEIYNKAYDTYYATHSDTKEIKQELERTKEYMDELLEILQSELKKDPVATSFVDITKLQLVEVTRKKIRKPFYEAYNES